MTVLLYLIAFVLAVTAITTNALWSFVLVLVAVACFAAAWERQHDPARRARERADRRGGYVL